MTEREEQVPSQPEMVTKIEGAERLLKTAVDLFFEDKDTLSIHALSSAAHEVLRLLLKHQGKQASLMKDYGMVRPDKVKEFHDLIHRTQNFLKHAARDPDAKLEYYKAETPFWLFDAIQMFTRLGGGVKYKKFALFVLWFDFKHPYLLDDQVLKALLKIGSLDAQFIKDNYKSLLEDQSQTWLNKLL